MTNPEITWEDAAWETALRQIPHGGSVSAAEFLMLTEELSEDDFEQALLCLDEAEILPDVSTIRPAVASGRTAQRLAFEAQWVRAGASRRALEETDPLRLCLEEIDALETSVDLQKAARRFADGYEQILPALTNAMLPAVAQMALEMTGHGVLLTDLIQEGSLGLWQGILCYRDGDFRSHARRLIARYLAKAVTVQARQNGIGGKMKQAVQDYRAADEWLLAQLGRNPTVAEIAEHIHLSEQETQAVADTLENARLLQRAKASAQPQEDTEEDRQAVEDTALFQMRQRVAELLERLDETDAKLLSLRFGLEDGKPLSIEQCAQMLNISAQMAAAREAAALEKLRTET